MSVPGDEHYPIGGDQLVDRHLGDRGRCGRSRARRREVHQRALKHIHPAYEQGVADKGDKGDPQEELHALP